MKRTFFSVLGCVLVPLALNSGVANANPEEIPSPVEKIFVPNGFDDNDNVQVILHGEYPNNCYKVGRSGAEVDEESKTITVWATSFMYPTALCIQVLTPFLQEVRVGVLQEGEYTVVYKDGDEVRKTFQVRRRTTESPEDYLYAPVENAQINVDQNTGKQSLKIQGHFPYMFVGCMVLREVRVQRDPPEVLVVQPISEIVDNEECDKQPSDHNFEIQQGLAQPFAEEGLIHVRVLNGDAVNRFVPAPN